ncbi:MAG: hypothetical protein V4850_11110 [Myxococcota bacterium]
MRRLLVGLALAGASAACAGTGSPRAVSDWMDEGTVQVHGVSDGGAPLIGGGLVRRVSEGGFVGFRGMLPVWGTGSYTGEVFGRGYFTPDARSSLFLEGDAGLHLVRGGTTFIPSVGLNFGVRVAVTDTLSVGGSFAPIVFPAGLEPKVDFVRMGPLGMAPRMLGTVDFKL